MSIVRTLPLMSTPTRLGWAALVSRTAAGAIALLVIAQATSAGTFLSGRRWALALHREMALTVISWLALLTVAAAVLAWRPGRHSGTPAVLSVVGLVGIGLQIAMGFARDLSVHLPLGVVLFGIYLWIALGRDRRRSRRTQKQ